MHVSNGGLCVSKDSIEYSKFYVFLVVNVVSPGGYMLLTIVILSKKSGL